MEDLRKSWEETVSKNSTLHKVCLMNDENMVSRIKKFLIDGTDDPSKIAVQLVLQGKKGITEEIQAVIDSFGDIELPLSNEIKGQICSIMKYDRSGNFETAAAMITELRDGQDITRKMTEEQVEDVMNEVKAKWKV